MNKEDKDMTLWRTILSGFVIIFGLVLFNHEYFIHEKVEVAYTTGLIFMIGGIISFVLNYLIFWKIVGQQNNTEVKP